MKKYILILILFFTPYISFSVAKYEVIVKKTLIELSSDSLYSQVGVVELTNHNDGWRVVSYLESVGRHKGEAWCQSLQWWAYWTACKVLNISFKEIPMYKSGLANDTYRYAVNKGKKVSYKPEVNDFIVWRINNTNKGHIGRVIKVLDGGWVQTIEGNTSSGKSGSQNDGDGVYIRKRNIYHPLSRTLYVRGLVGVKPKLEISYNYPFYWMDFIWNNNLIVEIR